MQHAFLKKPKVILATKILPATEAVILCGSVTSPKSKFTLPKINNNL